MGIFSLFGKKDRQRGDTPADAFARKKRDVAAASLNTGNGPRTDTGGGSDFSTVKRKVVAQATTMKIDAIESEMSSEFVKPLPSEYPLPGSPAQNPAMASVPPSPDSYDTVPGLLPNNENFQQPITLSPSEAAPLVDEAAILFANGQMELVESMLLAAIQGDAFDPATLAVWRMLLELYQVTGKRPEFESLSIEYASKFETSPPAWVENFTAPQAAPTTLPKTTPTVPFAAKLDGGIVKQLERVQNLAANHHVLRLEFMRVTEVTPVGCGILLSVLKKLQRSGNDLILVGAPHLAGQIRAILEVGRRDETEIPWLLLLEILQLLNLEKEFEEASIDYCVTFEVSPPAFVAPKNRITTVVEDETASRPESGHFMMPAVITGRTDQLIDSIAAHAADHHSAILDCMHLLRVDFGAAGQLLTGLMPIASAGAEIELRNVNHLVAALFQVIGLQNIARILPRKN
ncbi:MAG TPA: STAS domain-containing protein [Paucimonas sp.]|nr:STAS domain-containing protein [Paucimonas sp.]